jgi:hypothetical protein
MSTNSTQNIHIKMRRKYRQKAEEENAGEGRRR